MSTSCATPNIDTDIWSTKHIHIKLLHYVNVLLFMPFVFMILEVLVLALVCVRNAGGSDDIGKRRNKR